MKKTTKTLYVRGVDDSVIDHITKHHLIEGFKNRGEYINALLKAGMKAYKKAKPVKKAKKTPKKVVKKAK